MISRGENTNTSKTFCKRIQSPFHQVIPVGSFAKGSLSFSVQGENIHSLLSDVGNYLKWHQKPQLQPQEIPLSQNPGGCTNLPPTKQSFDNTSGSSIGTSSPATAPRYTISCWRDWPVMACLTKGSRIARATHSTTSCPTV
eukprot:m.255112 g.255112  ORF g.255112 m.255112 type:complete len:141 (+) comp16179_c0_seq26:3715-4137(+)